MKNNTVFIKDLLAGLTVSFAALALGAAFGTMSGRGAFAGMIGAAIIPIITSIFGGTRLQASGPTGPMTAVTAVLVAKAYDSFPDKNLAEQYITLTILLSAIFLILAGILKLGKLIKYVPNVIVIGFMNGIAVLIWYDQILKLFGLGGKSMMKGNMIINLCITVFVLCLIFLMPFIIKKINVPKKIRSYFSAVLIAIIIGTLMSSVFNFEIEKVQLGTTFNTLEEYKQIVLNYFPSENILKSEYIKMAIPMALQLMLLGYLDSLLTSLVVDKIVQEKTKVNKELIAQGLANGVSGLLQGISGAQATIRSVLLIKEQAQTRLAGVSIGVFVLIWILFFKNMISLVPSAVFAGVLFKAGWDVLDREYFEVYFQKKWKNDFVRNFQMILVLYTTIVTVLIDLNVAVFSGTAIYYLFKYFIKKRKIFDVESEYVDEMGV